MAFRFRDSESSTLSNGIADKLETAGLIAKTDIIEKKLDDVKNKINEKTEQLESKVNDTIDENSNKVNETVNTISIKVADTVQKNIQPDKLDPIVNGVLHQAANQATNGGLDKFLSRLDAIGSFLKIPISGIFTSSAFFIVVYVIGWTFNAIGKYHFDLSSLLDLYYVVIGKNVIMHGINSKFNSNSGVMPKTLFDSDQSNKKDSPIICKGEEK